VIALGIDPGIRWTGIAWVDTHPIKLLATRLLEHPHDAGKLDGLVLYHPKAIEAKETLISAFFQGVSGISPMDLIVIEYPVAFARAAGNMIKVAFMAGQILNSFVMLYPCATVRVSSAHKNGWRKFYGQDFDPKWKCEELFGLEKTTSLSAHEIDAALMGYAAAMKLDSKTSHLGGVK